MYCLSVEDLQPGMIVNEDLFSIDQNLIATKGTVLSAPLIRYLPAYGIFFVHVRNLYPDEE